jgi:multidrug resistance efflux pump
VKLSFDRRAGIQQAISPHQIELRRAPVRRQPVGRVLLAVLAVLALVGAAAWWLLSTSVRTYGVVATGIEVFHAPVRSKVLSVQAEPGDRVTADQVLFLLASEDAAAEMKGAQESLLQEQRVLEVALAQENSLFEDPIQELRDLTTARSRLEALEAEQPAATLRRQASVAANAADLAKAKRAVAHHEAIAAQRERDFARVQELRRAQAASADELRAAEEAARSAGFEAATARDEVERVTATITLNEAQAQAEVAHGTIGMTQARGYLDQLEATYRQARDLRQKERRRGIENIRSRLTSLEARIAHLRTLAGPTEVRALADGVVTEVLVSEGSNVPRDGMIMSVAGTGKVWINAFVQPERAKEVKIGDPVRIYPTTGSGMVTGKVTAGGGIQYKVHAALQGRLSDASAVYIRIDLDTPVKELIPGNVAQVVIH